MTRTKYQTELNLNYRFWDLIFSLPNQFLLNFFVCFLGTLGQIRLGYIRYLMCSSPVVVIHENNNTIFHIDFNLF